ncbi:MAG TPA: glucoamylase family protein [Candidatus Solibacter sp.]|nr:glucoamylase family protein [Candidatus Solibacter sp.]
MSEISGNWSVEERRASDRQYSRREMLRVAALGTAALPLSLFASRFSLGAQAKSRFVEPARVPYPGSDDALLDEVERTAFDYFWNEAGQTTGQVKDRALLNGNDQRKVASIAATGFGLTGMCIGDARGYRNKDEILTRVRATLRFLWQRLPQVHGFYYHFIDLNSGEREWQCEISSIDTSLLLCGVLTARQYFQDAEIQDLATKIYERVDWPWLLNGGKALSMGWHPESGFLDARWEHYCELMMIYLLAMGSPTHAISSESWEAWTRPTVKFQGIEYISGNDPLFTHQYSQAWFDFRHKRDAYADYFENSVKATKAHKAFCLSLRDEFPDYSDHLWGITASDSAAGYQAWGGPPRIGKLDGSVVPCATGGSLPFLFDDCMRVLRTIRERYAKAWGRYGLIDAFNPLTDWYNADVIGIDVGITMLMAENQRTGLVWKMFMKNKEAQLGMQKAGFRSQHA